MWGFLEACITLLTTKNASRTKESNWGEPKGSPLVLEIGDKMPHFITRDAETGRLRVTEQIDGSGAVGTLDHMNLASMHASAIAATSVNTERVVANTVTATNVNFKRGQLRRAFPVPLTKDDVGTTGTLSESFITFPQRVRIVGMGIMSAASDVVLATNDGFELRTVNGTKLATFVADADYTLGTGEATKQAIETATEVATNHGLVFCVATAPGVSGSVYYFVDYRPIGS